MLHSHNVLSRPKSTPPRVKTRSVPSVQRDKPLNRSLSTSDGSIRHGKNATVSSPPVARKFLTTSKTVNYAATQHFGITHTEFSLKETPAENHTSRFFINPDNNNIILRRGNTIVLKVHTTLSFTCEYTVSLVLVGSRTRRERFGEFRACGVAKDIKEIWLSIAIPPKFPIGRFQPHVTLTLKGVPEVCTHFHPGTLTVLFNPWNPEDDSFLEHEEDRREYLLCDRGIIWRGNERQPLPTPWYYGQFEESCLDAAISLIGSLGPEECQSATLVSRGLISKINARDNTGVLVSGYTGSLSAGIHPCRWTGSAAILQKYNRSKFPVKYGQCFTFAAVAVTLLRALGIASRPITCYNCAFDTSQPGKVVRYFTSDGDLAHSLIKDSVWVYHVWLEAWMQRDDLPLGFNGWQVLDPISPPRLSGKYRIGPTSVTSVREKITAESTHPYNCSTVYRQVSSEVHYLQLAADVVHLSTALKHASLVLIDRSEVAPMICASIHNKMVPIKVTDYYHSVKSDIQQPTSTSTKSTAKKKVHLPLRDCSFEVTTNDGVILGDVIHICVKVHNSSGVMRQIAGKIVGKVIRYTGAVVQNFMSMKFSGVINPGQDASVSLPIESSKYIKYIIDQAMLQFFVIVTVKETQQAFIKLHNFRFHLPEVEVVCPNSITSGAPVRIKLKFRNPLSVSLSRVTFLVEGKGLCPMKELSYKRLVLPGAIAAVEFPIKASHVGKQWLIVTLHSDQLTDVRGWTLIDVTPPT